MSVVDTLDLDVVAQRKTTLCKYCKFMFAEKCHFEITTFFLADLK